MTRHNFRLASLSLGQPKPEAEQEVMEKEAEALSVNLAEEDVELTGGTLVLDGSGQPGNEVLVLVDGEVVGTAEVNSDGTWSIEATEIEAGDHQIQIQTLDSAGEVESETETVSVSVSAPTIAANAPELIFPVDGADLLVGQVTIVGSGDAGTTVEILDGADVIGEADVDASGTWTFMFEPAEGEYLYSARASSDETAVSGVIEVMVTNDTELVDCNFSNPGINQGETYIVGTCDTLVEISQDLGLEYEDLIEANPQLDADYSLIYPGQILNLP